MSHHERGSTSRGRGQETRGGGEVGGGPGRGTCKKGPVKGMNGRDKGPIREYQLRGWVNNKGTSKKGTGVSYRTEPV